MFAGPFDHSVIGRARAVEKAASVVKLTRREQLAAVKMSQDELERTHP